MHKLTKSFLLRMYFPWRVDLRAAHVDGEVSADIDRRTDVACDVLHLAKGNEQISGHPLL